MDGVSLYDYQEDALRRLKNGSILCGDVGSGKSRTGLAYYYIFNGGQVNTASYRYMRPDLQDLYIITTARKRDTKEWEGELAHFRLSSDPEKNYYTNTVTVDSWNNIAKYRDCKDAFFIFDEQRVVGNGAWVKSFLKIARYNNWILLSATPGDTWMDYIPIFVANGFYRNRTEFITRHVVYNPYNKFHQVSRYLEQGHLIRLKNEVLVTMDYRKPTELHHIDIFCEYDTLVYKALFKTRWNVEKNQPIVNASELCYALRKIVNTDESRLYKVREIIQEKHRAIVFYNFDYELELLKNGEYGMNLQIAEWNGHRHEPIPDGGDWLYLVQYTAGAEGWNCIKTDTIIFYSQSYSYKTTKQAAGRIDRLNTPYTDLYFYHLKSKASIDLAIAKALKNKKQFNERGFIS